jgi:hypothetical protein
VADETIIVRVFGHQHLFQGSYEAYDEMEGEEMKQRVLMYFQCYCYFLLTYGDMEALGNLHNVIGHMNKVRDSMEILKSIRRNFDKVGRPEPQKARACDDKEYMAMKKKNFNVIRIPPNTSNNYHGEWTLATAPDNVFQEILKLNAAAEQGNMF